MPATGKGETEQSGIGREEQAFSPLTEVGRKQNRPPVVLESSSEEGVR
jgi:hypothetical protein